MRCIIVILFIFAPAAGMASQSFEQIRRAAQNYGQTLLQHLPGKKQVRVGPIDSRLKLASCGQPLQAFLPPGTDINRMRSLGVRCDGDISWTIYVPVKVTIYAPVFLAAHAISRGHVIGPGDIRPHKTIVHAYQQVIHDKNRIIGKATRRTLQRGEIIRENIIHEPVVVKRGETVELIIRLRGLQVKTRGIAMDAGTKGKSIRVRNPSTRKIVTGVVQKEGLVFVNL